MDKVRNIGIYTFHSAHNYGAILQAWALQLYLKNQGYKVGIVDYKPAFISKPYAIIPGKILRIRTFVSSCFLFLKRLKRRSNFVNFVKKELFIYSEQDSLDLVVVGSDQVWNKNLTNGFDERYWGNGPLKALPHIAYAASLGHYIPGASDYERIENLARNFHRIGLREELPQYSGSDIERSTVLDPTLLLPKTDYINLIGTTSRLIERNYVLVYEVRKAPNIKGIASKIAAKNNLEVVEIPSNLRFSTRKNKYSTIGPKEFLNLFFNADFIVTTSFHGTAFSLIFEKEFYNIQTDGKKDSRAQELLLSIGLDSRMIDTEKDVDNSVDIDYLSVSNKLKVVIRKSKEFLEEAILNVGS